MFKKLLVLCLLSVSSLSAMQKQEKKNDELLERLSSLQIHEATNILMQARALERALTMPLAPDTSAAIKRWPAYFYTNVYPGAKLKFVSEGKLEQVANTALNATPEKASSLSTASKETYDWVYALRYTEQYLLCKPFEEWTVADVNTVNQWVARLTAAKPGVWRGAEEKDLMQTVPRWIKRVLKPEETALLKKIEAAGGPRTTQERSFYKEVAHLFPAADLIPELMHRALTTAQAFLKADKQISDPAQKLVALIKTAAYVHFNVLKIHAWQEAHKRTARLIMNIILAQAGIEPVTFECDDYALILLEKLADSISLDPLVHDSERYKQLLTKALEEERATLINEYVLALLKARQAAKIAASAI